VRNSDSRCETLQDRLSHLEAELQQGRSVASAMENELREAKVANDGLSTKLQQVEQENRQLVGRQLVSYQFLGVVRRLTDWRSSALCREPGGGAGPRPCHAGHHGG
jgi:chromosome segregation ATPase